MGFLTAGLGQGQHPGPETARAPLDEKLCSQSSPSVPTLWMRKTEAQGGEVSQAPCS